MISPLLTRWEAVTCTISTGTSKQVDSQIFQKGLLPYFDLYHILKPTLSEAAFRHFKQSVTNTKHAFDYVFEVSKLQLCKPCERIECEKIEETI